MLDNSGEKKVVAMTGNEVMRKLTAQVADVNQPLLAVSGMVSTGHRVAFDDDSLRQCQCYLAK